MSILISGDFHANAKQELEFIKMEKLLKKYGKKKYDEIKYHIMLGDAGFMWPGNEEKEQDNYRALAYRPFPVLCVMGNHEPVLGRNDLPEIDIGLSEKVILVREDNPFVAYLKRGKIYKIENHKFLVLGGALSIDKNYRVPGRSWWEQEYWSEDEKKKLFMLLKRKNEFDFILSHTGPARINMSMSPFIRAGIMPKFLDQVAVLNESIDEKITCKQWFCGHWHEDKYFFDNKMERGYQYLYKKTALLESDEVSVK